MDLRTAFLIEEPSVSIPWGVTKKRLFELLASDSPRRVTSGYLTLRARVLDGLNCMLGFHFRKNGLLSEIEFFREDSNLQISYDAFQRHFEQALGPPSRTVPGDEGFSAHEWLVPDVRVVHYVVNRFGPEEHMRIQHLG